MPDLLDRVFADDRSNKIVRKAPPPEGQGDMLERVFAEPEPADDTGYSYDEPAEYEKQLKETLDMASELEIAIGDAEDNYKSLTEKPDRKPMATIPEGYTGIRAAAQRTGWQKFKFFFTGEGRPVLPPDADRTDKAARALDIALSAPLRGFM